MKKDLAISAKNYREIDTSDIVAFHALQAIADHDPEQPYVVGFSFNQATSWFRISSIVDKMTTQLHETGKKGFVYMDSFAVHHGYVGKMKTEFHHRLYMQTPLSVIENYKGIYDTIFINLAGLEYEKCQQWVKWLNALLEIPDKQNMNIVYFMNRSFLSIFKEMIPQTDYMFGVNDYSFNQFQHNPIFH